MEYILPVFLLVTIGSILGLAGGVFFILKPDSARFLSGASIPFAAGVLLTTAFLDVLPESIESSGVELALAVVLISLLLSFIIENFLLLHHHHEIPTTRSAVPLVIAGDTLHNFIDGVSIAAAFLVDPKIGVLVATATLLHEIPHEIGDFGIMLSSGWKAKQALFVNFISACASYFGAVVVLVFSYSFQGNLGIVLAITSGMFLYLGASDFLPMVRGKQNSLVQILWLVAGVVIMWFLSSIVTV